MARRRHVPLVGTGSERATTPQRGTESATRVADVLLLFMRHDSLGVTEIARELDLSKAVVHRILQSLQARALVSSSGGDRTYHLGPAAAALGAAALRNLDLRQAALPVMRSLAAQTGETVTLSALVGSYRVYLEQLVSPQEIRMEVELGRPFPLHAGASSRAILAVAPPELQEQVLSGRLARLTPRTVTERAELEEKLQEVRERGVAIARGERHQGSGSVAAGIFGADGSVVGAISTCGPLDRFHDEAMDRFTPLVRDAADAISRRLAWPTKLSDADRAVGL